MKPRLDRHSLRLARNTGWLAAGGVVSAILAAGQTLLVARILGVTQFGYLALIVASVGVVMQLAEFRTWEVLTALLPPGVTRGQRSTAQDLVRSLLLVDIVSGLAVALVGQALRDFLARSIVQNPALGPLIGLYALTAPFVFVTNGTCTGVFRSLDRFSLVTIKSVAFSGAQLLGSAVVLAQGYGMWGIVSVYLATEVGNAVVSLILAGREVAKLPGGPSELPGHGLMKTLKGEERFVFQVWLSGTIKGLHSRVDVVLLGALASPSAAGMYRVALELAGLLGRVGSPVQDAMLPILAELGEKGHAGSVRRLISQTSIALSVLLLPVLLGLTMFAGTAVRWLAGEDFAAAAPALIILAAGISLNTVLIWVRPLMVARRLVAEANRIAVLGLAIEILMIFWLVPEYQATGAAIATVSMYAVVNLVAVSLALRSLDRESLRSPG